MQPFGDMCSFFPARRHIWKLEVNQWQMEVGIDTEGLKIRLIDSYRLIHHKKHRQYGLVEVIFTPYSFQWDYSHGRASPTTTRPESQRSPNSDTRIQARTPPSSDIVLPHLVTYKNWKNYAEQEHLIDENTCKDSGVHKQSVLDFCYKCRLIQEPAHRQTCAEVGEAQVPNLIRQVIHLETFSLNR